MAEKEFKEVYLPLLIKHFDLTDETIDSLNEQLFFEEIAKDRVRITKMNNLDLTYTINKGIHEAVKDKLKKYADESALAKYMEEEGWKYEPKKIISSICANTFIIYHNDDTQETHHYVRKYYPSRYDMWEFEKINDEFSIAYD